MDVLRAGVLVLTTRAATDGPCTQATASRCRRIASQSCLDIEGLPSEHALWFVRHLSQLPDPVYCRQM